MSLHRFGFGFIDRHAPIPGRGVVFCGGKVQHGQGVPLQIELAIPSLGLFAIRLQNPTGGLVLRRGGKEERVPTRGFNKPCEFFLLAATGDW